MGRSFLLGWAGEPGLWVWRGRGLPAAHLSAECPGGPLGGRGRRRQGRWGVVTGSGLVRAAAAGGPQAISNRFIHFQLSAVSRSATGGGGVSSAVPASGVGSDESSARETSRLS